MKLRSKAGYSAQIQQLYLRRDGNQAQTLALTIPMGPTTGLHIQRSFQELSVALQELPSALTSFLSANFGFDMKELSVLQFARKKGPRTDKKKGAEKRKQSGDRERNVGHKNGEEHSRNAKGNRGRRGGRGGR